MFNALNIFYNTRKTPDFSGFPVILPNPNRITLIALSGIWEGDFVLLVKHLLNQGVFTWFSYTSLNNFLTEDRCTSDILLGPFLSPYRLISSY